MHVHVLRQLLLSLLLLFLLSTRHISGCCCCHCGLDPSRARARLTRLRQPETPNTFRSRILSTLPQSQSLSLPPLLPQLQLLPQPPLLPLCVAPQKVSRSHLNLSVAARQPFCGHRQQCLKKGGRHCGRYCGGVATQFSMRGTLRLLCAAKTYATRRRRTTTVATTNCGWLPKKLLLPLVAPAVQKSRFGKPKCDKLAFNCDCRSKSMARKGSDKFPCNCTHTQREREIDRDGNGESPKIAIDNRSHVHNVRIIFNASVH